MRPLHSPSPALRLIVLAAACLAGTLAAAQDPGSSAAEVAGIGRRYRAQCAKCHTAPDARFETDRAWLGRIPETT